MSLCAKRSDLANRSVSSYSRTNLLLQARFLRRQICVMAACAETYGSAGLDAPRFGCHPYNVWRGVWINLKEADERLRYCAAKMLDFY